MRTRRGRAVFAAVALVALTGSSLAGGVTASAETAVAPIEAIDQISEVDADDIALQVLENAANLPADEVGEESLIGSVGGVSVAVPTDPADPITLDDGANTIGVSLPFAETASDATAAQDGVVSFDNGNGSSTVPVVRDDGSVQIMSVVAEKAAPIEYTYAVDLPAGATIELVETGALLFLAADGSFLGGVAPAWAYDSNGDPVSTRYEVVGNSFTQLVQHRADGVAYPVVADPWLNQQLYWMPWVHNVSSTRWQVNVKMRDWGTKNAGPITWFAHRDEVKNKLISLGYSSTRWNNTIEQQFMCHVAGVPASLWYFNMESWRANMSWSAMTPWLCNYPEGGWGSVLG